MSQQLIETAMTNKTTVMLTDQNLKKIQLHRSALQANSTKNITFTDAINNLISLT